MKTVESLYVPKRKCGMHTEQKMSYAYKSENELYIPDINNR